MDVNICLVMTTLDKARAPIGWYDSLFVVSMVHIFVLFLLEDFLQVFLSSSQGK